MTYDIFYFFNEFDLLEMRLEMFDKHVDYFVICEANETFAGKKKDLALKDNMGRYAKWKHKIIYHEVTDVPTDFWDSKSDQKILGWARSSPNVTREHLCWMKEFYIKEHVRKALTHLKPDDVCYISDLDEFWNPDMKLDFTKDVVYKPKQLPYSYYLNLRTNEDWLGWSGTIACNYKVLSGGILNHLRTDDLTEFVVVENGGWHFGNQGGVEGIKQKLLAMGHPAYDVNDLVPKLEERVNAGIDFRGRPFKMWVEEKDLPEYLITNKNKWRARFL
jgi:beta-1,4-mannosyl-glycoprotein beta-1,4-N-acetylglucosaminyltransferase